MIEVHHLNNSRSQRVLWLLEELGLPYEVVRYQRDPATMQAPPALRQVHPLGKSPVVRDGGETVAETGAIVEHLLERHGQGRLVPAAGSPEAARYRHWLHFAEGSAMPPLLVKLYAQRLGEPAAPLVARIDAQLAGMLDYLEAELGRSAWFAGGTLTAADIMMSFPLEVAVQRGGLDATRPRLWALLNALQQRPAYRRALERGGPYGFAL